MLNAYPLPTPGFQQGTSNWIGAYSHYSDLRKDTFKFDYLISNKHRISLRGTLHSVAVQQPVRRHALLRAVVAAEPHRPHSAWSARFSPTFINEFTFLGELRRTGLDLCRSVVRSAVQPQRGRLHLPVHLSGHEVGRRQAAVDHRRRPDHDRQRSLPRNVVRLRLCLGEQHDESHQQPHRQIRRVHRTLRPERSHPVHYCQRSGHHQRERILPFPRHGQPADYGTGYG